VTSWLSEPIETLLLKNDYPFDSPDAQQQFSLTTDILVVGSGYGAAMAALALLEPDLAGEQIPQKLWVFERGHEYVPDDFPKTTGDLPGYAGTDNVNPGGLWDLRAGDNVVTISGRGLGGTSLVNANVAARPDAGILKHWPGNEAASGTWAERFSAHYAKLEQLLGVAQYNGTQTSRSFRALADSARELGGDVTAAPLTINFAGPTAHSADHKPCNNCGNCVIGCHSGAKGSLNMNAWPLAKQLGAELFTGITVKYLQQLPDGRWQVHCESGANSGHRLSVIAGHVILAAGTLGSTEILKRSADKSDLGLSATLGQGFSTNGDALIFGIGQNSVASTPASVPGQDPPSTQPGPTISGMASVSLQSDDADSAAFTLEDAVIPYPLQDIWQELLVSQALLRRFADGSESAWHRQHPEHDALARSSRLGEHSQTLLIMGLDESCGELTWEDDRLRPVWQQPAEGGYFRQLDQRLRADESRVFDGGLYVQNILSQPLPPGLAGVVEGAEALGGQLLSVHPLGGCCMAEHSGKGVVNACGQVFTTRHSRGVFENLRVLDGAIIPGAIGTNPFLTIASLSYALGLEMRKTISASDDVQLPASFPPLAPEFRKIPRGGLHHIPADEELAVEAVFSERMVLHLSDRKRSRFPWSGDSLHAPSVLARLLAGRLLDGQTVPDGTKSLVLDIRFEFAGDNSLDKWLENPARPLEAHAVLSLDPVGSILTTPDEHLARVMELSGQVNLGATAPDVSALQTSVRQLFRTGSAVLRYLRYRGIDLLVRMPRLAKFLLPQKTYRIRYPQPAVSAAGNGFGKTLRELGTFWRIGKLQAQRRYLVYEFQSATGVRIAGRKTLGYGLGQPDLLKALLVLPVNITAGSRSVKAALELDVQRITKGPAVLQITRSPHTPASVLAVGGLGMYFLRMIMSTHFWSFAAPTYAQYAEKSALETSDRQGRFYEPPEFIYYGPSGKFHSTRREKYERAGFRNGQPEPVSRLVRYQPMTGDSADRPVILLVHGLAHSSRVFWTDTIACNYLQYFLDKNYDVWILDHRASANYIRNIDPTHTWDDIARSDIPWAVNNVFGQVNRLAIPGTERGVHVFAHCIGAGAVSMAVLGGHLDYEFRDRDGSFVRRSMLASLVPHAVTPWLTASGENRTRANLWTFVKELDPISIIEPLPYRNPGALEMFYDRLAALGVTRDERRQWDGWKEYRDWRGPGFARAIYTRYTIFWGRQWHNKNISKATRYEFAGMIGPVPIGVIQQVYFSITRGLLSNHDGNNTYVRDRNFKQHWTFPTLFLHGNRNTVFDMESSRHSADQLTRLRQQAATGSYPQQPLAPADYARQQVWIEVLENYGHMDMIFSKHVQRDVLPRLHEFFSAVEAGRMTEHYAGRFSGEKNRRKFLDHAGSNSHAAPSPLPVTGPIISAPRKMPDGKARITVWSEAQDFVALTASALSVTHGVSAAVKMEHSQNEFWRTELDFEPQDASHFSVAVNYYAAGTPALPKHAKGLNLYWQHLPWFQRSFFQSVSGPERGSEPRAGADLTLLAGSCLYPGLPFERDLAMSIFRGMHRHILDDRHGRRGADFAILLGDQIYADATADLFDPKVHYERFRNPYRNAFGSQPARDLFSHLPVYFAIDDHEYRNNWQGHANQTESAARQRYHYARKMASLFQMHQAGAWNGDRPALWHSFEQCGHPVFVLDTRFERKLIGNGHTRLLDEEQAIALRRWVRCHSDRPVLMLASGSPLAPLSRAMLAHPALATTNDSLLAYPQFLRDIIELLHDNTAGQRVVWLTGDPHFSCFAELKLACGQKQISVTQVCCSGLYAPMPFVNANINDYDWDSAFELNLAQDKKPAVTISGRQELLYQGQQHFVRIDMMAGRNWSIRMQPFGPDGEACGPAREARTAQQGVMT
tara:strand:- start:86303 stop:91993 length:5691 start_codon:yes stop_codon:yes gene_type:complete